MSQEKSGNFPPESNTFLEILFHSLEIENNYVEFCVGIEFIASTICLTLVRISPLTLEASLGLEKRMKPH